MRIKERLQKLEKTLKPYQETTTFYIYFVDTNSDGSMNKTLGIISYADGRWWFNPEIYAPEEQKLMYAYWSK